VVCGLKLIVSIEQWVSTVWLSNNIELFPVAFFSLLAQKDVLMLYNYGLDFLYNTSWSIVAILADAIFTSPGMLRVHQ